jgi:hypothetical protein
MILGAVRDLKTIARRVRCPRPPSTVLRVYTPAIGCPARSLPVSRMEQGADDPRGAGQLSATVQEEP